MPDRERRLTLGFVTGVVAMLVAWYLAQVRPAPTVPVVAVIWLPLLGPALVLAAGFRQNTLDAVAEDLILVGVPFGVAAVWLPPGTDRATRLAYAAVMAMGFAALLLTAVLRAWSSRPRVERRL